MQKKFLIIFLFIITSNLSASYYYLKFGSTIPPIHQNGNLPSLGLGGRLSCGPLSFDLSLTGSTKKKNSYLSSKGCALLFLGPQLYIGGGGGISYFSKSSFSDLISGASKTTLVNLEGVIGYENCGRFIQLEVSKPIYCSHHGGYKWGFAVMLGQCF